MKTVLGVCGAFALACAGVAEARAGASFADEVTLPREKPASELFKDVPAPWREYLLQARKAERIADPLQRCLAYPDLPGNRWPDGHAEAHCRDHAVTSMSLAEVSKLVGTGQLDALESYVRGILAAHRSSEEIHVFMTEFRSDSALADETSRAWLAAAPKSAFALNARAAFLASGARRARGGAFAAETPRANLERMHALYLEAVPLFERAIKIEPGLITAYEGLLEAGYRDSESEWARKGFEGARKVDPGCPMVAGVRMDSLQPRWGGSYEAMLAYAAELEPQVQARPLLAVRVGAPYADRGDRLVADKQYSAEAMELLGIAIRKGSLEAPMQDAAMLFANAEDPGIADRWKALAYAMQAARFSERDEWTHRMIAWYLLQDAPDVSVRHIEVALRQQPDNTLLHYIAGASYYNSRHPDEAESHYLKAIEAPKERQASLRELVTMWMFDAGLEPKAGAKKAKPYLDRLVREYPEDGRARLHRIQYEGIVNGRVEDDLVKAFESRADKDDPMQAHFLNMLAESRKNPIMRSAPAKGK